MTEHTNGVPDPMIGGSAGLIAAKSLARRVAHMDIPVLIVGETGTGKELLARYLHAQSGRRGSFVDVDCGALPSELMESLLFGHRRGAFTGAVAHSRGLLLEAEGGSLLLDELGNLPLSGQAKLLRVLETGEVREVGGARHHPVSFRTIATAQRSLGDQVRDGAFRQDLFQRVAGVVIRLPSLSERREDIPRLARHFAREHSLELTDDALEFLSDQAWPGNIRQLRWTVTRASVFQVDGRIDEHSVENAFETGPRVVTRAPRDETEPSATTLAAVCRHHKGDADQIAEVFGIGRSTLYRWLKQEGMTLGRFRSRAEAG